MNNPIVLSASSPNQATAKVMECISTWSIAVTRGALQTLELTLNGATSAENFILAVAVGSVIDPSTQSSEAVDTTLADFMDLLSTSTDSVMLDLDVITATLSDFTIYPYVMAEDMRPFNLTISAKAGIAATIADPAELGDTANTFTANSMSTAHGYLGLRIAQCLESGVDQWGYIVSANSRSKFRIDIRNPKGDRRGVDKQSFLALAKDNMETLQAWVHSGYLKQNDMNIGISSTGSAIVRLAYIGKVSVLARDREQYDQYKGKETISASYRS